jgi:WD40 repeat protein
MKQFILVILLGAGLFIAGAWQLGLPPFGGEVVEDTSRGKVEPRVAPPSELGGDLYQARQAPKVDLVTATANDPIILYGSMNPVDHEEVASQVNGQILFIGEEVDHSAVLAAGSAAFMAEPYYSAEVYGGRQSFVKVYRRIYDGEIVRRNQMVGMIQPGEALGSVLEEIAKVDAAQADQKAAQAGEQEGFERRRIAEGLFQKGAIGREELATARLTAIKLHAERVSKDKAIDIALAKKDQADIRLRTYEIRPTLPVANALVKTIVRQRGAVVKQGDPVLIIQNLDRLQAEALIDEAYLPRLRALSRVKDKQVQVTATIEPSILEGARFELPGHALEITSIAVSKDMKIVSGSEDRSVCVWEKNRLAALRKLEHDDPVRVVACTPTGAAKNLCVSGTSTGSIYLWDLAKDGDEPLKIIPQGQAHGLDTAITSLAFSPDGAFFASGASDGSIKIWFTSREKEKDEIEFGVERYAFKPENGVGQRHEDAITALHFTPQAKLVSASRDKTLRVWLLKEKGAVADRKAIRDRVGNVPQLGVSQDGRYMLFDQGKSLKLFSVESRTFTQTLNAPVNSTPFDTLAIFSPDSSLILTAGAPEGRLQLWRTPDATTRGFEVRQFGTRERMPVACAAFSPAAGKGGEDSFAVSASGSKIYVWPIPTAKEVAEHRIERVRMTLSSQSIDPATKQTRLGFEVPNPTGRFEAGRPVTIVID